MKGLVVELEAHIQEDIDMAATLLYLLRVIHVNGTSRGHYGVTVQ